MKVKISGDGTPLGTKVWTEDGRDLTSSVSCVSWRHRASDLPEAALDLLLVPIDVNGVAKMIGPGGREIRRIEYADGTVDTFE